MWIRASSQLTENVYLLTTAASSHFLVVGEKVGLVDCGIGVLSNKLIDELKVFLGPDEKVDYLFLTHSHFDHVGGLCALREYSPNIQVVGSPLIAESLNDKEYSAKLLADNISVAESFEEEKFKPTKKLWQSSVKVDKLLGDGDGVDLGFDVEVKLFYCAGHTGDSVAYYVSSDGALHAGDAVGDYKGRDKVYPCFTSSYKNYLASLDKFIGLDVKVLGLSHSGALTGDMVPKYLSAQRDATQRFFENTKALLSEGKLVEEICDTILPEWEIEGVAPDGPFVEQRKATLREMVQAVVSESN